MLGINLWGPIHGCHVFAPILREAGHWRHHQRRVRRRVRRRARDGRLQRQQGRRALAVGDAGRRTVSGTGVNVTVLCPTFVKTNIVDSGRITGKSTELADRLMRWTGFSPERVARTCLDTHDRGGLYCMPQPDARIGWGIKRFTPTVYTRAVGLTNRALRHPHS